MKILNIFLGGVIFMLPTVFARFIVNRFPNRHIGKGTKIGFSLVLCDVIEIGQNCKIGHLNVISCHSLKMIDSNKIMHLNQIKGYLQIIMENGAWINSQNKISSPVRGTRTYHLPIFLMNEHSAVIIQHLFDVTDDVTIGSCTTIAGAGTQIWTHAFYRGRQSAMRVDGSVVIGDYCYIGARCVICAGVNICSDVALGAGTIVAKNIESPGLYVSQPLRFIEYDGDKTIDNLEKNGIKMSDRIYQKQ